MPSLRKRFSDYRKTKKRKAHQKKVAAEGHGKTKRNKKQKKQRKTHSKRHHKIHHDKPSSPIQDYPPAKHVRLKKLLITALASSPGIAPFKSNPTQTGESGVKDIEYDTFKYYGVPKSAYKVGKEYAKSFARQTKEFKPNKIQFLPVVEEPLITHAYTRTRDINEYT